VTAERPENGRGRTARAGVVEASLIGVAGFGAVLASFAAAPGRLGVAGAALAALTLAIAVVDRRRLIIPDELSASAFIVGLAATGLTSEAAPEEAILNALMRAAVMFGAFFAFRLVYRQLRGREGIGLGDVKLAGVAGVWLDWTSLPIAVEIAALCALGFVASRGIRARRAPDPLAKLPFGTFLAPSIWLCWLLARWWS